MRVRLRRATRFFHLNSDGTLGGSDNYADVPAGTILPSELDSPGMLLVRYEAEGNALYARLWASDWEHVDPPRAPLSDIYENGGLRMG